MRTFRILVQRNCSLFFKDKGLFFTSLITPVILLVLYLTFLGNVYRDSLLSALPGISVPDALVNGFVGGQLCSSILAVSCVTVAFCSNMLMVQDKVTGARRDFTVSPVPRWMMALAYYAATACSTALVCLTAAGACFGYLAVQGWYLSAADTVLILADVLLTVLFGTALSTAVNFFLSSQGQMSAVGTIVSSGYGFICGAYMPVSQFSEGLQAGISFLPGTYATSLLRDHFLRGTLDALSEEIPSEAVSALREMTDCEVDFFGTVVSTPAKYGILIGAVAVLILFYIGMNFTKRAKR